MGASLEELHVRIPGVDAASMSSESAYAAVEGLLARATGSYG